MRRLLRDDLLQVIGPRSTKTATTRPYKESQPVVTPFCCIQNDTTQNASVTGRTKMAPLGSVRRCAVQQEKKEREKQNDSTPIQQPSSETAPSTDDHDDMITEETVTVIPDDDIQALEIITIEEPAPVEVLHDQLVDALVNG